MLIPLPCTTVYLVTGTPIPIPPDLTREELDRYVALVQTEMDQLTDQAERVARGELQTIVFRDPVTTSISRAA